MFPENIGEATDYLKCGDQVVFRFSGGEQSFLASVVMSMTNGTGSYRHVCFRTRGGESLWVDESGALVAHGAHEAPRIQLKVYPGPLVFDRLRREAGILPLEEAP
jgi:hypothetical protein